jgi:hypothetical protein
MPDGAGIDVRSVMGDGSARFRVAMPFVALALLLREG